MSETNSTCESIFTGLPAFLLDNKRQYQEAHQKYEMTEGSTTQTDQGSNQSNYATMDNVDDDNDEYSSWQLDIRDLNHAVSLKAHLDVLTNKVNNLKQNSITLKLESDQLDNDIETVKDKISTQATDFKTKHNDMQQRFSNEIDEINKQANLSREMLAKKIEEHNCLVKHLNSLNLDTTLPNSIDEYDWESLKKTLERPSDTGLSNKHYKAERLRQLNEICQSQFESLAPLLDETVLTHGASELKIEEVTHLVDIWTKLANSQMKKLESLEKDSENLNMLVKQCAGGDNRSECIARNIRQKCESFLSSSDSDELLAGLEKHRRRQANVIRILKYKEGVLCREVNQLTIANDETSDHMDYYRKIISKAAHETV